MKWTGWVFINTLLLGVANGLECRVCQLKLDDGSGDDGRCEDDKDLGKLTNCGADTDFCLSTVGPTPIGVGHMLVRTCGTKDNVSSADVCFGPNQQGPYNVCLCKKDGCNSRPHPVTQHTKTVQCHECNGIKNKCDSEYDGGEKIDCDPAQGNVCQTVFTEVEGVKTSIQRMCADGTSSTDHCIANDDDNQTSCSCKSDLCNAPGLNYWHQDPAKPNPTTPNPTKPNPNAAERRQVSNTIITMVVAMAVVQGRCLLALI